MTFGSFHRPGHVLRPHSTLLDPSASCLARLDWLSPACPVAPLAPPAPSEFPLTSSVHAKFPMPGSSP